MQLSENHRRRLTSILVGLDEALCQMNRWARGRLESGPLFVEEDDLSAEQKRAIAAEIDLARGRLRDCMRRLRLERQPRSIRDAVAAHCSTLWADLCELEASRLKQYGKVPPQLQAYLEPKLEALKQSITRISQIARRGG